MIYHSAGSTRTREAVYVRIVTEREYPGGSVVFAEPNRQQVFWLEASRGLKGGL